MQSTLSYHRLDLKTGVTTVEQITLSYGMESSLSVLMHTLNDWNKAFAGRYQYWV